MSKNIYVGNLSFNATEDQVRDLFAQYGTVNSVNMIMDRDSGRFRGFAFVEMEDSAANAAINSLNDTELDGRKLRVNEARPREERGGGKGKSNYRGDRSGQGGGSKKSW
ncbi:MAG: RNA recognition motif domain-containing protein [Candidatus Promineifilaceae bacterium]